VTRYGETWKPAPVSGEISLKLGWYFSPLVEDAMLRGLAVLLMFQLAGEGSVRHLPRLAAEWPALGAALVRWLLP
jgi:hypothetical protein